MREKLTDLENESIEKSKLLGKQKADEILEEFQQKADDLRKENQENLREIEEYYNENSDELIKNAFDMLMGRESNV